MIDRNNSLDKLHGAFHRGELALVCAGRQKSGGLGVSFIVPTNTNPFVMRRAVEHVAGDAVKERNHMPDVPAQSKPRFTPTIVPKEPA